MNPKRTLPSSTKPKGVNLRLPPWDYDPDYFSPPRQKPKERVASKKGSPETRKRGSFIGGDVEDAWDRMNRLGAERVLSIRNPKRPNMGLTKDELIAAVRKLPKDLREKLLRAYGRGIRGEVAQQREYDYGD